jgi:peptide/nickel transport system permease protein
MASRIEHPREIGSALEGVSILGARIQPRVQLIIGLCVLLLILGAGFLMPRPYDPNATDASAVAQPPSTEHWFGTDSIGRDVFSRVIDAAQRDLPLSAVGTAVSLLMGVPLGLLASKKGKGGERVMRALDAFQSFPLLVLAIAIVSVIGNDLHNVVVAIALISIPRFMRLIRAEALALRESRFIDAAIAVGCSPVRVMFRHLLPNVLGVVLVQSSLTAAQAVIVIASMNFVGIGVHVPDATWGSMLQAGARNISLGQWWMSAFPGLAVLITVFTFNHIGDSLDALVERPYT